MLLKFPVARLFLHDLLHREKLSGAQAIAAAACRYDLVQPEAVAQILQKPSKQCCECFYSAALIVSEFFRNRQAARAPLSEEEDPSELAHQQIFKHWQESLKDELHCAAHAPALFDIILQVLTRYK